MQIFKILSLEFKKAVCQDKTKFDLDMMVTFLSRQHCYLIYVKSNFYSIFCIMKLWYIKNIPSTWYFNQWNL